MKLESFLAAHQTSLDELRERLGQELGLQPTDVMYACGSLVEGLGNETSDLDLSLVTARSDLEPTSLNDILVSIGSLSCDINLIPRAFVDELSERFNTWAAAPSRPRQAKLLSPHERRLLHRLHASVAIHGEPELARLRARIAPSDLLRHRLAWARYHVNVLQVDLGGMASEGDWACMVFVAQDLLGHVIDALLAAHGHTNPTPKWRAKLLEAIPTDWERRMPGRHSGLAAQLRFLDLHAQPDTLEAAAVLDFVHRILGFSRIVMPYAERCILAPEEPAIPPATAARRAEPDEHPLPDLELTVTARRVAGLYEVFSFGYTNIPLRCSPELFSLLCLFDGETSRDSALEHARTVFGDAGPRTLDQLSLAVRSAGLERRDRPDPRLIAALLE